MDGQPVTNGTGLQTDPTGRLDLTSTPVPAPFIAKGSRDFSVTLTEQANPANTVTATAKTTALNVSVRPRKAKPSRKIRFRGSGFTDDKSVYAHYLYKGKVRRTVRMARSPGTCGTWRKRARQIPVDEPGTGTWTVQFDQSREYRRPGSPALTGVYVRLRINVTLVPG
jgi:hypothetical protein